MEIDMHTLQQALTITGQGMAGIFVTIGIIMAVIWTVAKLSKENEKSEEG